MTSLCILLTAAQAEAVRGPTAPGAALAPAVLADGVTYVLPAEVLDDPAHAMWHSDLSSLPRREVEAEASLPVPTSG